MRIIFSLITLALGILVWSCQPSTKDQKAEQVEERPTEWLHLRGREEIRKGHHIVLVSGDEEYRSEEALPQLAQILSQHHGYNCTVLFSQDPDRPGIADPNESTNILGLEVLGEADLMILFTRFRELPDEQMHHFQNYLLTGKPMIAIRTSTHAFRFVDTTSNWRHWGNYYNGEKQEWHGGFGQRILGENWLNHHGHHKHQSTRGMYPPGMKHPILSGIEDGSIWGPTDVYGVQLPEDAIPILYGQVVNREGSFDETDLLYGMRSSDMEIATTNPANVSIGNPNDPMMPIVWEKKYQLDEGKTGTAITSTIGASTDFLNSSLRRLFVNAVYYLLESDVPEAADVNLVGEYQPSQYQFHSDSFWIEKNPVITKLIK